MFSWMIEERIVMSSKTERAQDYEPSLSIVEYARCGK
jgi:hypothetical protein